MCIKNTIKFGANKTKNGLVGVWNFLGSPPVKTTLGTISTLLFILSLSQNIVGKVGRLQAEDPA